MQSNMKKQKIIHYLLTVAIIGSLLPVLIPDIYIVHLLVMTIIYTIVALSLDIIIGQMGQFSFGHQVFFGLGSYTTAILITRFSVPLWVSIFAGIALPGLSGMIIGLIALKRARGFFLGIITLAIVKLVSLLVYGWSSLTKGSYGVANVPPISISLSDWFTIEFDTECKFYYFVLATLILVIYLIQAGMRSRIGRAVTAIRENEDLAKSIGVNTYQSYVVAFTFACAVAGLAGVCYAHYMRLASPKLLDHETMLWLLIIVIVGGSRSFTGIMIGSFIYVFLPEYLAFAESYRMVVISVILLLCILIMRKGIVPTLKAILEKRVSGRKAITNN
jgi:branched-chain amino acid transport system permease protein